MSYVTGLTRGRQEWTPIRQSGRRQQVHRLWPLHENCAHGVLAPKEVDEEESAKMFASVKNPESCIGCEACGRTCNKKAFSFEPLLM